MLVLIFVFEFFVWGTVSKLAVLRLFLIDGLLYVGLKILVRVILWKKYYEIFLISVPFNGYIIYV